jgi:hypothetical protein
LVPQAQKDPLENPPIKAVCRATSAAPTYFPPIHFSLTDISVDPNVTREFNLIDGGVVVNNPVKFHLFAHIRAQYSLFASSVVVIRVFFLVEQTYLAITQAIKEAESDGAVGDRVDYTVSRVVNARKS